MRVCRITSEFPPPWQGLAPGPYELSIAQARRGIDLTVITKATGDTHDFDQGLPFKVIRIPSQRDILFSLKAAQEVRNLNKKQKIDLVHAHGFSALGSLLLRKFRIIQVPVVISVHILREKQRKNNGWRERWTRLQEKLMFRWAEGVCAVSDDISNTAHLRCARGTPIFPVYNGVHTDRFYHIGKYQNSDCLRLIFVGVLNGRKGEADLQDACNILVTCGINFELTLIGDGENRNAVEEWIRTKGMTNRVKLIPKANYEEMPKIYNGADVFVLPSYSEGMPKVLLEAMACGLPAVVTDIPGCRELVAEGKNGYLVPLRKPDSLAQALRRFADKPALIERMGHESRRIIENNYTWDAVAARVDECYRAVLLK